MAKLGPQFRVDELLADHPDDREEFEIFARDPGHTIDECRDWLLAKGYTPSRNAVWRWLGDFRIQCQVEKATGAGQMATAMMAAVKDSGGLAVADATVQQVCQMIFESAASRAMSGEIDPEDLKNIAASLNLATKSKATLEATRAEMERQKREAFIEASRPLVGKREITQADLDEAAHKFFG